VDAAVAAAQAAQPKWAARPAHIRASILRNFSDLMAENRAKITEVIELCLMSLFCFADFAARSLMPFAWANPSVSDLAI